MMRQYFIYLILLLISVPASAQNVGIGVPNPGAKLEVAGGVKISDSIYVGGQVRIISGTPGEGKVLTSNATGLASWQTPVAFGPCGLTIGQTYQGGIIFYLDPSGCHGLISAPTDQSTSAAWWNGSYLDTRAYGSGLFEGNYNIVVIQYVQGGTTSAAAICSNLTIGVYSDWYLPSIHELRLMYQNIGQENSLGLGNVGGFAISIYWSSTEFDFYNAWYQDFYIGSQNLTDKNYTGRVRAVRAF
jgi:Protein of unknown function (DUF1566)